jgi:hypothetical protein
MADADRALDCRALGRARPITTALDVPPLPLITPENLILFKLERAAAIWPRRGVDWYDLEYRLKFRKDLDHPYLDAHSVWHVQNRAGTCHKMGSSTLLYVMITTGGHHDNISTQRMRRKIWQKQLKSRFLYVWEMF